MSTRAGTPRVLHVHGSFAQDDPQARRCARLIDAFGGRLAHTVVSGSGDFSAADALAKGMRIRQLGDFPALRGLPLPGRLQRIARALQDYDLVLTYGRAATDAALAHTMFSKVHALPPLIHHEDGSDETARQRRGVRSKWMRRVGLGKASGLVVPSETMEYAALMEWQQPLGRVKRIADGVDLEALDKSPRGEAIPRLIKRPGELWIGCHALFDGSDTPNDLLAALPSLDDRCHLVVVGAGRESGPFLSRVTAMSLDNRVHVIPPLPDPNTLVRLADIVAFAGGREPLPRLAIAAMAASKPLAGFDTPTGEIATCVSPDNAELMAGRGEVAAMIEAMVRLAGDRYLRQRIGEANREKAQAERNEAVMIASYRRLYASAMKRDTI